MTDDIREPMLARDLAKELGVSVKEVLVLAGFEKGSWNTTVDARPVRLTHLAQIKSSRNGNGPEAGTKALVEYDDSAWGLSAKSRPSPRASDYETVERFQAIIDRYRELKSRPEDRELVPDGSRMKVWDPFSAPEGDRQRWIWISLKDAKKARAQGGHYPLLSPVLLRDLTDMLGSLWLVQKECDACGKPQRLGLLDKVYKLLDGTRYDKQLRKQVPVYLPLTRGVDPQFRIKFPQMHNVCRLLLEPLVLLETRLQHLPVDDPDALTQRAEAFGAMIRDVMPQVKKTDSNMSAGGVRVKLRDIIAYSERGLHE